jgi:hypothetical protein
MYEIQIITIVFDIKSNWFGDDKRNKKKKNERIEGDPNLISLF